MKLAALLLVACVTSWGGERAKRTARERAELGSAADGPRAVSPTSGHPITMALLLLALTGCAGRESIAQVKPPPQPVPAGA